MKLVEAIKKHVSSTTPSEMSVTKKHTPTAPSDKTKPPKRRNRHRSYRTPQARMLGLRRDTHEAENPNGNWDRKALQINAIYLGSEQQINPSNNDLRARHPQNKSRKSQHPLQSKRGVRQHDLQTSPVGEPFVCFCPPRNTWTACPRKPSTMREKPVQRS